MFVCAYTCVYINEWNKEREGRETYENHFLFFITCTLVQCSTGTCGPHIKADAKAYYSVMFRNINTLICDMAEW